MNIKKDSKYKRWNLDDKDRHPVGRVQMKKDIRKKSVLPERQNAKHRTGEAIIAKTWRGGSTEDQNVQVKS